MALKEEFEKTGNWLFQRRSYLPFLIVPLLLLALRHSEQLEVVFGNTVQTLWEVFCIVLSFLGFAFRCLTLGWVAEGTSGRNTKGQLAESLNTEGVYSIVRHPLYLGNFLIMLGFSLFVEVWWFALAVVFLFWIYYEKIMFAEEEFLRRKFGPAYEKWANETPVFWPDLKKWKRPSRKFSVKMILRREYSGFFGIIVAFIGLKILANWLGEGEFEFRVLWGIAFLGGLTVYLVLRTLRRKTNLLK